MGTRLKLVLYLIAASILLWFVIIVNNLPRNENLERWAPEEIASELNDNINDQAKNYKQLSKIDESRHSNSESGASRLVSEGMSKLEIIFHQLNIKSKSIGNQVLVSQDDHEKSVKALAKIHDEVDRHVKAEGDIMFAFNLLVSNRVGLFRPIPDTRHKLCRNKSQSYAQKKDQEIGILETISDTDIDTKPTASIIICYYNEAPSALLRTIYSILKRSPIELIKEIIIIDDYSDTEFHYETVKRYLEQYNIISFHRTVKREGLIRARLFGSAKASGDVLVFLDSHVEANQGWLEPLLEQIKENRTTVACPMIDLINAETLVYSSSPMVVGGLTWALHFKWDSVESDKLKNENDFIKPLQSPTMAGGLYAIDRAYFHALGEYDPGMNLWGGENVEFSLRVWLCGGRIVILPCSRFGHIFRKRRPYGPKPDEPDSLLYNSHRAARVWLDDYIEEFYKASPAARNLDSGKVGDRQHLRRKLECKNFSWYLKHIYPNLKTIIDRNINESKKKVFKQNLFSKLTHKRVDRSTPRNNSSSHRLKESTSDRLLNGGLDTGSMVMIKLTGSDLCLEPKRSYFAKSYTRLVVDNCIRLNSDGSGQQMNKTRDQFWYQTSNKEYRMGNEQCLDLMRTLPSLRVCHKQGLFQEWISTKGTHNTSIFNPQTSLCLGVEKAQAGESVIATICDDENPQTRNGRQNLRKPYSTGNLVPSRRWDLIYVNKSAILVQK